MCGGLVQKRADTKDLLSSGKLQLGVITFHHNWVEPNYLNAFLRSYTHMGLPFGCKIQIELLQILRKSLVRCLSFVCACEQTRSWGWELSCSDPIMHWKSTETKRVCQNVHFTDL